MQAQRSRAWHEVKKGYRRRIVEPSAEAEAGWCETIERTESKSRDFQFECTPGYYNKEGQLDRGPGFVGGLYGGGPIEFQKIVDEWLSNGEMRGLKFS